MDNPLITREEIFKAFWPHLSVKEATNVFHVTKGTINEALGFEVVQYGEGFYTQAEGFNVSYDAEEFERKSERMLLAEESASFREWNQLAFSYTGHFLAPLTMPWAVARREQLRKRVVDVYIATAKSAPRPEASLQYLNLAHKIAPLREDLNLKVIEELKRQGRPHEARRIYRDLEVGLQANYQIQPMPELQAAYAALAQV